MSQARPALCASPVRKVAAFLVCLAFGLLWLVSDGGRSQLRRDDGGLSGLSLHPDEGLRQVAHQLQKRGEDRSSGALPDPAAGLLPGLTAPVAARARQIHTAGQDHWSAPLAVPARQARAPPRAA